MARLAVIVSIITVLASWLPLTVSADARIKELARIEGVRDNALVGYGLVTGLDGSGDTTRNRATQLALVNTLANFGVRVAEADLNARNSAAVMVTATLPPFAEPGDKINVLVSSLGDARSLTGGTLLLTPLYGPDQKLYALAQGPMAVGGYKVEAFASSVQKNHATVGQIPQGATIEQATPLLVTSTKTLNVILNQPDFTTAQNIAEALRSALNNSGVRAVHAGKVEIPLDQDTAPVELIAKIENIKVIPDHIARIVINERTGTVVAGGDVRIGAVSIAQGDLEIVISTQFNVSQPFYFGSGSPNASTVVVPDTHIDVKENEHAGVTLPEGTSVSDLVHALQRIKLGTRDIISIIQAVQNAGALHAELVVQ